MRKMKLTCLGSLNQYVVEYLDLFFLLLVLISGLPNPFFSVGQKNKEKVTFVLENITNSKIGKEKYNFLKFFQRIQDQFVDTQQFLVIEEKVSTYSTVIFLYREVLGQIWQSEMNPGIEFAGFWVHTFQSSFSLDDHVSIISVKLVTVKMGNDGNNNKDIINK